MRWRRLEVAYTAMFRARRPRCLKDGFQGGKVVVIGGEAQVIDEEDEPEGVGRQLIHQVGNLVELVLLDLHQPQAVGGVLIGNGLDRAGFAGAGIAVEQNIVGGGTGQQGAGVGNDLFPLLLVAGSSLSFWGSGYFTGTSWPFSTVNTWCLANMP